MKHCLKTTACLLLLILLDGCSAGRYYTTHEEHEESRLHMAEKDIALARDISASCEMPNPKLEQLNINTVFVHPGMLWLDLNCGKSITAESANILVEHGYARDYQELCDRNPATIGERMQTDPGTRFIGLHYSLGGQPQLVASTLATVAQARQKSGKALVYYPVLVDPFDIEQANTLLDLDAPHLGQMFIVLSAEYSLLRQSIEGLRDDFLGNPKVHLIYAEDFGENWGHFDELESVVSSATVSRFREIFFLIAETVVNGYSPVEFEKHLAVLKLRYAIEDSRPMSMSWLRLAQEMPCAKRSTRIISARIQKR